MTAGNPGRGCSRPLLLQRQRAMQPPHERRAPGGGQARSPTCPHSSALDDQVRTVADVAGPMSDSDRTAPIPWSPVFDEADDLDGILSADSPLLARAFRGADRRR